MTATRIQAGISVGIFFVVYLIMHWTPQITPAESLHMLCLAILVAVMYIPSMVKEALK